MDRRYMLTSKDSSAHSTPSLKPTRDKPQANCRLLVWTQGKGMGYTTGLRATQEDVTQEPADTVGYE